MRLNEETCHSVVVWDKWDALSIDVNTERQFRFDIIEVGDKYIAPWEICIGAVGVIVAAEEPLRIYQSFKSAVLSIVPEIMAWLLEDSGKFVSLYSHGKVDDILCETGARFLIEQMGGEGERMMIRKTYGPEFLDEVWEVVHASIEYGNPCSHWAFVTISPLADGLLEVEELEGETTVRFERKDLGAHIERYNAIQGVMGGVFPEDPGEIDDEVVDCLVQAACLGEIVYG
jgi:hypothetical protein